MDPRFNEGSVSGASTLWEAHKAFFRGECISAGSRYKCDRELQRTSLLDNLSEAEKRLLSLPTVTRLRAVVSLRNRIKSLDLTKFTKSNLWSKQKFYEFANKPHRMLVNKLRPRAYTSTPDHLIQSNGVPTYCPRNMSRVFGDFYQGLYNCLSTDPNFQFTQDKFDSFVESLRLPTISTEDRIGLNAPISVEEITEVVKQLPNHKAPGPDGFSYPYFKGFLPVLLPHMANLFSSLMSGTIPHSQFLHAFITVIPKPGKDPSLPDNYRPIALLNSDYKIFTKILANRLSLLLPSLVHGDQVGFVPSRQAGDNTRRTIDLIDLLTKTKKPALILSLDAQKAFDRLNWSFMFAILRKYGFSGPFVQALKALYSSPSSQVQMASHISPSFTLTNGTRQGCPLSPLLFILSLEPLAEAIRSHPDISGVRLRQREYKLSLFADDILLTLTHPHISLPSLHTTLALFGDISGYKINSTKTEALPINISEDALSTLQGNFNYRWCPKSLKYLGVYLTPSYSTLFQANFPSMFTEINNLLKTCTKFPLSLLGRINVLKMSILPKLLYLFETLPVMIPLSQLKILQRSFLNFIWDNKSHRVASSVLLTSQNRGSLGAPEIIKYYYATHLRAIASWTSRFAPNRWSKIEMSITIPAHPCSLLWPSTDKSFAQLRKICLNPMLFTLSIWKKCSGKFSLTSHCSPLINITFNPYIPDSLSYEAMLPWTKAGIFQLRHIVHPITRKILTFSELQSKHGITRNLFYSFLQIQHFFSKKLPQLTLSIPTQFELTCSRGPHEPGLISTIYKILQETPPLTEHTHAYMRKWSHILDRPIALQEWREIWEATSKVSRCVTHKETADKVCMFWYRTPDFLLKHKLTTSGLCWRCGVSIGTHYHIFWDCPVLLPFWTQIHISLEMILNISIPFHPIHLLLGLLIPKMSKHHRKLMAFVLLAAKWAIPQCWLTKAPPTFAQFLNNTGDIRRMEHLTAIIEETLPSFDKTWEPWDASEYNLE